MTRAFTDYHCHLIPGLDDGSSDLQESLAMARVLSGFGFSTVHCTPHRITHCYPNEPAAIQRATAQLQRLLDEAGIPLVLVPGSEHYLDEYLTDQLPGALRVGSSRYLLVEVPFWAGADILPSMVDSLLRADIAPLIAHPERCRAFEPPVREKRLFDTLSLVMGRPRAPEAASPLLLSLRESGCRFQGNLGSFAGVYGSEVKQRAIDLLREGVYSCLGSDAHRSERLSSVLADGLRCVVGEVGEEAAFGLLAGLGLQV